MNELELFDSMAKEAVKKMCKEIEKDIKRILKDDAKELLEYWNSKKIIVHRERESTLEKIARCRKRKKDYSTKEIKEAIDNYATVINSRLSWWKWKWSLWEFLTRDNSEKFFPECFVKSNFMNQDVNTKDLIEERIKNNPFSVVKNDERE